MMQRRFVLLFCSLIMISACGRERAAVAGDAVSETSVVHLVNDHLQNDERDILARIEGEAATRLDHLKDARVHRIQGSDLWYASGLIDRQESLFAEFHVDPDSGTVALQNATRLIPADQAVAMLTELVRSDGGRQFPTFPHLPDPEQIRRERLRADRHGWSMIIPRGRGYWSIHLDRDGTVDKEASALMVP